MLPHLFIAATLAFVAVATTIPKGQAFHASSSRRTHLSVGTDHRRSTAVPFIHDVEPIGPVDPEGKKRSVAVPFIHDIEPVGPVDPTDEN
jgi:hypothetical protein